MDGVFDFEEENTEEPKPKYIDEDDEETIEPVAVQPAKRTTGHGTDLEPPLEETTTNIPVRVMVKKGNARESQMLSQSVPVSVPARMATPSQKAGLIWNDDDDEESTKFEKPHELAAKTYQERYIKTGLEWDVPTRYTRKVAYSFAGK